MKTIIYLCIASLAAAMAIDYRAIRPVLANPPGPEPLEFPGIVEVFTRHDRIPVARYAMRHNGRRNWDKIMPYLVDYGFPVSVNPNLMLRGVPHDWEHGGMVPFETVGGTRFRLGGMEFSVNEEPPKSGDRQYPCVEGMFRLVREETKGADRRREESNLLRSSGISLYGGSWYYMLVPVTNFTTVSEILSQQIITNYTVNETPSDTVPPGLDGHH